MKTTVDKTKKRPKHASAAARKASDRRRKKQLEAIALVMNQKTTTEALDAMLDAGRRAQRTSEVSE